MKTCDDNMNRFREIFDEARKALGPEVDVDFLKSLEKMGGEPPPVPFPYGVSPLKGPVWADETPLPFSHLRRF